MYAMKPFFVEIETEHIPGDGWTAKAAFSRMVDYGCRTLPNVPKARFDMHRSYPTKGAAERDSVMWARDFCQKETDTVESAIDCTTNFSKN